MTAQEVKQLYERETGRRLPLLPGAEMNRFIQWIYNQDDSQSYYDAMMQGYNSMGSNFGDIFGDYYKKVTDYLNMMSGVTDPMSYSGIVGLEKGPGSAEAEKYTDNMIGIQNTQDARNWEQYMAQNSLLFNAQQLQQLGLSSNGVLSTGAASHSGVGAADNVKTNVAMTKYQEKMSMAKSLLGMTSQMARAGIMGGSLAASRYAAASLTASASHSALGVLKHMNKPQKLDGQYSNEFPILQDQQNGYDLTQYMR